MDTTITNNPTLPLDVSSRIEGLLAVVTEIEGRVKAHPVLTGLLRDFQEMAREFILRFESSLNSAVSLEPEEKWFKRHAMLDKLTSEWHLIYSLASSMELGSSFLGQFKPYVDQAIKDIGLSQSGEDLLLIPVFGEKFSLVTVGYSSRNIAILNLPVSVIHSPWELSVIWHEMAGLKIANIKNQIGTFLLAYAAKHNLALVKNPRPPGSELLAELFRRIVSRESLDTHFLAEIRDYVTNGTHIHSGKMELWSQDWFEQLYEDSCSVMAFGEVFIPVLKKILSRQSRKLSADWKHPDLETRIQVAERLLALQKGKAPKPVNNTERLTDNLLWAFIQETRSDPAVALPIAFPDGAPLPEVRKNLISDMRVFIEKIGELQPGTIAESGFEFGPMMQFAEPAKQSARSFPSEAGRYSLVKDKLLHLFPADAGIDDLLRLPFSPSDELNFEEHDHNLNTWLELSQPMYTRASNHGGHYVLHLNHA